MSPSCWVWVLILRGLSIIFLQRESPIVLWRIVPAIVHYLLYGHLSRPPIEYVFWKWPCLWGQLLEAEPLLMSPNPFRLLLLSIYLCLYLGCLWLCESYFLRNTKPWICCKSSHFCRDINKFLNHEYWSFLPNFLLFTTDIISQIFNHEYHRNILFAFTNIF